jgi:cysteine synthase A
MNSQAIDYIKYLDFNYLFSTFSDSILLPKIIHLNNNLYAAVFSIMKLLPAKYIISSAINRGEIKEGYTIVDTSSGTFALGIGIICSELGFRFKIFGDPAIDPVLIQRLEDLGGSIHISTNPKNPGAYQKLRLEALNNFISQDKLSYWMKQYDNLDNYKSYSVVGELILKTLGSMVNVVGTVGSGGSTAGIIKAIRLKNINAKLIGVDTFNSVLFGHPDGKRILRGLGNSIMPKNLNHSCYDEIHWVAANDAYYYTKWLFKNKAIFCGPTSGAAYQVANYLAKKNPQEKYIFIAPDEGYRYLSTVYNDVWLQHQEFYNTNITVEPSLVESPLYADGSWAYINWNRRTYQQVLGKEWNA